MFSKAFFYAIFLRLIWIIILFDERFFHFKMTDAHFVEYI